MPDEICRMFQKAFHKFFPSVLMRLKIFKFLNIFQNKKKICIPKIYIISFKILQFFPSHTTHFRLMWFFISYISFPRVFSFIFYHLKIFHSHIRILFWLNFFVLAKLPFPFKRLFSHIYIYTYKSFCLGLILHTSPICQIP